MPEIAPQFGAFLGIDKPDIVIVVTVNNNGNRKYNCLSSVPKCFIHIR